jgi:hypothetical protein
MATSHVRIDRWIPALGIAVLALGAAATWLLTTGRAVAPWDPAPEARALAQVRDRFGPTGEVRLLEPGAGRVVCGYAGRQGEAAAVAFVSRPRRILFSDDPLSGEFSAMVAVDCPGLPLRRPAP